MERAFASYILEMKLRLGENHMKHALSTACLALGSFALIAQANAAPKKAMTDQQFVDFAGQTDMVEVNLGKLAQDASSSQSVKDYGQMLISDHTANFGQLNAAAQQVSLTVPTAIGAEQNKTLLDPLEKLKGASFDKHYLHEMIAGHTKAVEVFKMEAKEAQNPVIKSYAEQSIPVIEKHLADAKKLEK
jgi:putative membrane protein